MLAVDQNNLLVWTKCLLEAQGRQGEAVELARHRAPWLFKSDQSGTTESDLAGSLVTPMSNGLFLPFMEEAEFVYGICNQYGPTEEYLIPLFIPQGPLICEVVGEAISAPAVRYAVDSGGITRKKAAGLAVITNEAMRTERGVKNLLAELREGVNLATDLKFLGDLSSGAGTILESTADILGDLGSVLGGVNVKGAGGPLLWAMGPTLANFLCTARSNLGGSLLFPDLTPMGGSLLGCQSIATAALSDDLVLIDPMGIVTAPSSIEVKISQNAAVEMDTSPAMDSITPFGAGKIVSMFQTESSAIIGIRNFGFKVMRASAVGVLTNALSGWRNWGSGESAS